MLGVNSTSSTQIDLILGGLAFLGVILTAGFGFLGVIASRGSRKVDDVHTEVKTNHGRRLGEYVENLADDVASSLKNQATLALQQARLAVQVDDVASLAHEHDEKDSRLFAKLGVTDG